MTGTIIQLPDTVHRGIIRTLDGSRLPFSATAVHCDLKALIVGQTVRFEIDSGRAQAIAVRTPPNSSPSGKPDLRYLGFEQDHEVRRYNFEAVSSGGSVRSFVVTVAVELFHRYHVNIQEGPTLCMRKLLADLANPAVPEQHSLSDSDLGAYASARALAAEQKEKSRRGLSHHRRRAQQGAPKTARVDLRL